VLDFQIAHRMQPGAPPTQAFQLQEMGTDGTGSLERSDPDLLLPLGVPLVVYFLGHRHRFA